MNVLNPIKLRKNYYPLNCDSFEGGVGHCLSVCGVDYRKCFIRKSMRGLKKYLFKQVGRE